MATITLQGNEIHTNGELPAVGNEAPGFKLVTGELGDVALVDFAGKIILNIVPSLDTGVCAASAKVFNDAAKENANVAFLTVSADLPFAQGRFCSSESLENIQTLSMMRSKNFAKDYGVLITDGPLAGLAARAVVVLGADNKVLYTELVPEIAQEPNYEAALAAL